MTTRLLLFATSVLTAAALTACDGGKDGDATETTTSADDTGTTPTVDEVWWEDGCITVSGASAGFANLEDAIEVAVDGDTVTLCEGSIGDTIAITEALTLVGPGPDLLTWTAPSNQPAITVSGASGVSLSGFTVVSTRNGVEVGSASDVTISNVTFAAVGNTGVKAEDVTGLAVEDCTFEQPPYGAVEVNGGTATVSRITTNGATGFAVHAINGAAVTVNDNTFIETSYSSVSDDGTVSDGFAVWGESGASLTTNGNTFENNFLGIYASEADLLSTDDTISGGLYGIQSVLGAMDVSGAVITDPAIGGIFHASTGLTPSVSDSTISGDPDVVDPEGSYGIAFQADSAALSGVDVNGFNLFGVYAVPFDQTIVTDFSDVTLTNTGRSGLYLESSESTLTDVSILDHRLVLAPSDLVDDTYTVTVAYGAAVLQGGVVNWDGGTIANSDFIGISQLAATLNASNITLDGNEWAGIFNLQGSLAVSGATVTNSSRVYRLTDSLVFSSAGIYSYLANTVIDGSHFVDNRVTFTDPVITPSETLPDAHTYEVSNYSQDIYSQSSPLLEVTNNTFENGSNGLYIYEGDDITVSGNTWTDYNSQPIYAYQPSSTVELTDNTMTNIGLYAIYGYLAALEIDGLEVSGEGVYEYSTVYYDKSGAEIDRQESSYSSWSLYCYDCDLEMTDASFADTAYHAMYLFYGTIQLYDVSISNVATLEGYDSYGAIYAYTPDALYAVGLDIDSPNIGYGLYLTMYSDKGTADLQDVTISGTPRHGIYLTSSSSYANEVSLDGVSITDAGEYGIYSSYAPSLAMNDVVISGSSYAGIAAYGTTLTMSESTLSENGMDGLYANGSRVSVTDSAVTDNLGAGMTLEYSTVVDISGNTVTGNGEYGLACDVSTAVETCSDNDLTENTLGELLQCAACADVDAGDTGDTGDTGL